MYAVDAFMRPWWDPTRFHGPLCSDHFAVYRKLDITGLTVTHDEETTVICVMHMQIYAKNVHIALKIDMFIMTWWITLQSMNCQIKMIIFKAYFSLFLLIN